MKRLAIRLSALSAVVALGLLAIAHAQRQSAEATAPSGSMEDRTTSGRETQGTSSAQLGDSGVGNSMTGGHPVSADPLAAYGATNVGQSQPPRSGPSRTGPSRSEAPPLRQVDPHPALRETPSHGDSHGQFAGPPVMPAGNPRDDYDDRFDGHGYDDVAHDAAYDDGYHADGYDDRQPGFAAPSGGSPRDAEGSPSPGDRFVQHEFIQHETGNGDYRPADRFADGAGQTPRRADASRDDDSRAGAPRPLPQYEYEEEQPRPLTARAMTEGSPRPNPAAREAGAPQVEGTGKPGARQLEGVQSPSLSIEKIAPAEMQVGKAASFEIKVTNRGQVAAHEVQVVDQVPAGTRLVAATPRAETGPDGQLGWNLGTIEPGGTATIGVELMPLTEGPIGSVASVHFRADASASTVATRPLLEMRVIAPERVMIGDEVRLQITLSNPGTGVASGVILEEDVPPQFQHEAGKELEFEVGDLAPSESRQIELTMTAVQAGRVVNSLRARADASLLVEEHVELEVIAPRLEVAVNGPRRRFLQRQATYTVSVSNPGTASARDVQLVTYLPQGMKFVEANNAGSYDAAQHAVFWSLEELPATRQGDVTLVTIPVEAGEQRLRVEGKANLGLADASEELVLVEGVEAVSFQVVDLADPIEVGGEASYEIRVTNGGSKSANNVRLALLLPQEMKLAGAQGPTNFVHDGPRVVFEPLTRLAPNDEQVYRVRAQALAPGDLRITVQLQTDDMTRPVTKEESTRVFSDQ